MLAVRENPSGQAGRCNGATCVALRGRHEYTSGWEPVRPCERHTEQLEGARRVTATVS